MQPIQIELWTDELNGACYVEDFHGLRQVDGAEILQVLIEDFEGRYYAELYRGNKVKNPLDDLIYLCIDHKDKEVRLFGCLRGRTIVLVHGIAKKMHTRTPIGEVEKAAERIKRIPN